MKKYLASLLSLILALTLVFTLVGCGSDESNDDEEEEKTSQSQKDEDDDMPPVEDSEDDEEETTKKPSKKDDYDEDSIDGDWEGTFVGEFSGMNVECDVEFSFDDGEYAMVISKNGIEDAIRDLIEEMADEEGLDVDELAEEQGYDSLDEYLEEYMDTIDTSDLETTGEYEFDGDTFVLDGEEVDFDYDGDTLFFNLEDVAEVSLERA